MIIVELMGPMIASKRNPEAVLMTTYLIWDIEETEELKTSKLKTVSDSIATGSLADVDHILVIEQTIVQKAGSVSLSAPTIISIAPNDIQMGPYSINLKALDYFAICHGKISKDLMRQIQNQVGLEKNRRESVNRLVQPVHSVMRDELAKLSK